jgi:HSP20 family protein
MALPARRRPPPALRSRDPWSDIEQTARRMTEMFDQTFGAWPGLGFDDTFAPLADLEETEDAYLLEVELPGVAREDIEVEVKSRRVTITGERKERERTGVLRHRTRSVGQFFYEAVVPGDVDDEQVSASLDDGVLTVTIPKAERERTHTRKVEIT